MTEETQEAVAETPKEEAQGAQQQEQQEAPNFEQEKKGLQEALIAERRKRQEAETYNNYMQQQMQAFQSQYQTKQPEDEEDEYTKELKQYTEAQVQHGIKSALEKQFIQNHPELIQQDPVSGRTWLEEKLEPILRKKPYLAQAIQTAENRYARALEIIDDYTPKDSANDTRKRIEENQNKPGSPAGMAKSSNMNQLEALKSMSRAEFSAYRAKIRGRAPNIR